MNKKKLNKLKKKWKSSDAHNGSFYAEMRRDGFVFFHQGNWRDLIESLCTTLHFIKFSKRSKIKYIISIYKLSGNIKYQASSEGAAICAERIPDGSDIYTWGYDEDLLIILSNIITRVSQIYRISALQLSLIIAFLIISGISKSPEDPFGVITREDWS